MRACLRRSHFRCRQERGRGENLELPKAESSSPRWTWCIYPAVCTHTLASVQELGAQPASGYVTQTPNLSTTKDICTGACTRKIHWATHLGLGYLMNDDIPISRKSEPRGLRKGVVTDRQIVTEGMGERMAWVLQEQHEQSGGQCLFTFMIIIRSFWKEECPSKMSMLQSLEAQNMLRFMAKETLEMWSRLWVLRWGDYQGLECRWAQSNQISQKQRAFSSSSLGNAAEGELREEMGSMERILLTWPIVPGGGGAWRARGGEQQILRARTISLLTVSKEMRSVLEWPGTEISWQREWAWKWVLFPSFQEGTQPLLTICCWLWTSKERSHELISGGCFVMLSVRTGHSSRKYNLANLENSLHNQWLPSEGCRRAFHTLVDVRTSMDEGGTTPGRDPKRRCPWLYLVHSSPTCPQACE